MTDTSQQQAPLPRHAANMPSAASKSKQDEMVTLLSPSRQNEDFFFFYWPLCLDGFHYV